MTRGHSSSGELRILHWNIHSWRDESGMSNLEAVAELMQKINPDIVSLVEVDETWDHTAMLDQLAVRTGYCSIFTPAFEFGHDTPVGGFGNALLSRLPVLSVRQRQLLWPPRVYADSEQSESRTVVLAQLQTPSRAMWVGCTHLPRNEPSSRTDAARRLLHIMQGLPDPWLLVGDFNMPAAAWLTEMPLLRAYPNPAVPTYPTKNPVEAIDYCVASEGTIVQVEVLSEPGSDHVPILVRSRYPA
jgi:endonuclease/exonuclease/phosphatase family metal-dependent hydrolase